jgi:hypothetical protein
MLEAKGIRVGMLGYTDDYRPAWPPAAATAGPAPARDELILQDLEAIRPSVDIVVLQLHWGVEFAMYPWLSHRTRARRYAEAGADLVLCHHAHVPMGVEVWKRSVIAYGLGNLVFPASRDFTRGHPWKHRSVVLKVAFDRSGISHVEMIPVETRPDFSVAPSTGARRAQMLGALGKASKGLQDSKKLARLEADQLARVARVVRPAGRTGFEPPAGDGGPPHRPSPATDDRVARRAAVLHRPRGRWLSRASRRRCRICRGRPITRLAGTA